jgi:hypothetical protein
VRAIPRSWLLSAVGCLLLFGENRSPRSIPARVTDFVPSSADGIIVGVWVIVDGPVPSLEAYTAEAFVDVYVCKV